MKKLKILLFVMLLTIYRGNAYATNANEVKAVDDKTVELSLTSDVILAEGEVEADIKILKDIEISYVSKDINDQNKIILNLVADLVEGNTYNLLSIIGPDVNIDFETPMTLEDSEVSNITNNGSEDEGVERLVVKDSKTLELYFGNIVPDGDLEFKMLNELEIETVSSKMNNVAELKLVDKLEKMNTYLIMILSMKDTSGNNLVFDEDLYEIVVGDDLVTTEDESDVIEEPELIEEPEVIDEPEVVDEPEVNDGEMIGEPVSNPLNQEDDSLENIALNSAETPDTGAETSVLLLLTFGITSIIYIRRKIVK